MTSTSTTNTIRMLQDEVNAALLGSDWGRDEWIGVHRSGDYEQGRLETTETDVFGFDSAGVRIDVVGLQYTSIAG